MEALTVTKRPARPDASATVGELLSADLAGDAGAGRELGKRVYDELRALAQRLLRSERPGHTLLPTDLVHEAYCRLVGQEHARPQERSRFQALAAVEMRRVLVDHARRHLAQKRGEGAERVPLSEGVLLRLEDPAQALALDEALTRLGERNERLARVAELRFLGGLSVGETAATLGVSSERVRQDWRFARAWLNRELVGG